MTIFPFGEDIVVFIGNPDVREDDRMVCPGWQGDYPEPEEANARLFQVFFKKRIGSQMSIAGKDCRFPVITYKNAARTMGELRKMIVIPAVTMANVRGILFLIW